MSYIRLNNILVARTFKFRLMGLMGKRKWPAACGGLFFPECRSLHTFFTFLKPDLVFVDKSRKILKIVPSASPWNIFGGPDRCVDCFELPQGLALKLGMRLNDVIHYLEKKE